VRNYALWCTFKKLIGGKRIKQTLKLVVVDLEVYALLSAFWFQIFTANNADVILFVGCPDLAVTPW